MHYARPMYFPFLADCARQFSVICTYNFNQFFSVHAPLRYLYGRDSRMLDTPNNLAFTALIWLKSNEPHKGGCQQCGWSLDTRTLHIPKHQANTMFTIPGKCSMAINCRLPRCDNMLHAVHVTNSNHMTCPEPAVKCNVEPNQFPCL